MSSVFQLFFSFLPIQKLFVGMYHVLYVIWINLWWWRYFLYYLSFLLTRIMAERTFYRFNNKWATSLWFSITLFRLSFSAPFYYSIALWAEMSSQFLKKMCCILQQSIPDQVRIFVRGLVRRPYGSVIPKLIGSATYRPQLAVCKSRKNLSLFHLEKHCRADLYDFATFSLSGVV